MVIGCDLFKEYVFYIVDCGEDLNSFGENIFVFMWSELEKLVRKYFELKYYDVLGSVLNFDY